MWDCKVCSRNGNLFQLKELLGLRVENVASIKDAASSYTNPSPLPDPAPKHYALMNEERFGDVLDYLIAERKFTIDVLKRMQIGADEFGTTDSGDPRKWVFIPYLDSSDHITFYKGRSVPPDKKAFRAPKGREARLYNERVITEGMEELVLVEGEMDCLSLLSNGYDPVCGVPGANVKKESWITKLDSCKPKTIYLLYDSDKVGQDAARSMATRIGLDRVKNIVLPEFEVNGKSGKDINEYFISGKTLDDFLALKSKAKAFDIPGVQSVVEILSDLKKEMEDKGDLLPKYDTPWPSLTKRVGGFEDGDLVGLMAEGKIGKTTMAMNWLDYYSIRGYPSFLYCGEMPLKRQVRKWASYVTQTDDTPGASQMTPDVIDMAIAIGGQRKADMLFGYNKFTSVKDVFNTFYNAVRLYGVKVGCFDNLQLLIRSLEHSQQETSRITKDFKAMAMDLQVLMFLIVQPHRIPKGQLISAHNAAGSSAIEKDVDFMICLHRERVADIAEKEFTGFLETEETFNPQMLARVDLARYSSGGCTTLYMDGARSTVREIGSNDVTHVEPTNTTIQVEKVEV